MLLKQRIKVCLRFIRRTWNRSERIRIKSSISAISWVIWLDIQVNMIIVQKLESKKVFLRVNDHRMVYRIIKLSVEVEPKHQDIRLLRKKLGDRTKIFILTGMRDNNTPLSLYLNLTISQIIIMITTFGYILNKFPEKMKGLHFYNLTKKLPIILALLLRKLTPFR